jgi:hypothetical protein
MVLRDESRLEFGQNAGRVLRANILLPYLWKRKLTHYRPTTDESDEYTGLPKFISRRTMLSLVVALPSAASISFPSVGVRARLWGSAFEKTKRRADR